MRLKSSCIVFHLELAVVADGTFFIRLVCVTLKVLTDCACFGHGRQKFFTQGARPRPPEDRRSLELKIHSDRRGLVVGVPRS